MAVTRPALTYPAQLAVLDKSPRSSFRVVNGGICEETSSEMLERLDGLLDKNSPDIAVMFIGSANLFKLELREARPPRLLKVCMDMRIYRMIHIISVNLRARSVERSAGLDETYRQTPVRYNHSAPAIRAKYKKDPASLTAMEKIWHAMDENDYSAAEAATLDVMRKKPDDPELLLALGSIRFRQGRKAEATEIVRKLFKIAAAALAKDPADLSARGLKAFCFYGLADMSISSYRFSEAIPYLLEFVAQRAAPVFIVTELFAAKRLHRGVLPNARRRSPKRMKGSPKTRCCVQPLYFRDTSGNESRIKRLLEKDRQKA